LRAKQLQTFISFLFGIILAGLISIVLLPNLTLAVHRPNLPNLELPQFINPSTNTDTQVATAPVHLDGRHVLTLAASSVKENSRQNNTSPIQLRIQGIEANLNRLINSNLNPATLNVKAAIDSTSSLPVISVNGRYLMTVTTLDAQLEGEDPAAHADNLTKTIKDALIQAKQEREPDFLLEQVGISAVILGGMFLSSSLLKRFQHRLRIQLDRIEAETPPKPSANPTENNGYKILLRLKTLLAKQQQSSFKDVQRRCLQLTQILIWSVGSVAILGLFPYTRWLQPIVLATPLRLFSLVALTYLQIRIGDYLIDRFFSALELRKFPTPDASQRFALRISTFSRVAKGLAKITALSLVTLALLAMIGIDVVPLLAGAGIAGLGITLAFQSLIKDMINGCLILLEDQYAVGDVVQIGVVRGLVEFMSLRITQLRSTEGRLITIPNNTITVVENLSKNWARVDLAIVISQDANIDRAIQSIGQIGRDMSHDPNWRISILETPEVLGVDDLKETGVSIRIWIKTQTSEQLRVGREFRRRLKVAFDDQKIAFGTV
jgi:moderate conductance mechanosensitive channel